jgi:hypothetical protein
MDRARLVVYLFIAGIIAISAIGFITALLASRS